MPKEIITYGPHKQGQPWIEIGWFRERYVTLGVRRENEGTGDEGASQYADLDREGINRMIRVLRKARDQAYGSDA